MGGLCKEGHEFLKICKKKNVAATLKMIDVLVTQHSKWTAKRVRRALFGQSLVDFNADPWISAKSQDDSKQIIFKKQDRKKRSRIDNAFSQEGGQFSQATTVAESTPVSINEKAFSQATTVVESNQSISCEDFSEPYNAYEQDFSNFQDFFSFQRHIARFSNSFQHLQHPHFLNEHFAQEYCNYIQEQDFSTSFLGPNFQQNFL